jgi:hypothetical protein
MAKLLLYQMNYPAVGNQDYLKRTKSFHSRMEMFLSDGDWYMESVFRREWMNDSGDVISDNHYCSFKFTGIIFINTNALDNEETPALEGMDDVVFTITFSTGADGFTCSRLYREDAEQMYLFLKDLCFFREKNIGAYAHLKRKGILYSVEDIPKKTGENVEDVPDEHMKNVTAFLNPNLNKRDI